jgi:1-acyl-sn-glycerol-3-phosphate acyltransferase
MMRELSTWAVLGLTRLLVGAYPRWEGCAPDLKQRVYFANHTSHLDTVVLCAALPAELRAVTHPVAALDYWGAGGLRRYFAVTCLGAILIDRSGQRDLDHDPLEPLLAALKAGDSLLIFPEGTRGPERLPAPFRSGLYHLARQAPNAEFVPVFLDNAHRAMPKGALLPVPLMVSPYFGAPVALAQGETKDAFLVRARDALIALAARER